MTSIETKIVQGFLTIKERLHEMEVRRDCTSAELLGHFCTELRRHYLISSLADVRLWKAPFEPGTWGWPKPIFDNGDTFNLTRQHLEQLCLRVQTMTEDDIVLEHKLIVLALQIPPLNVKTTEVERLTRKTTELLTEAVTFAQQQEQLYE